MVINLSGKWTLKNDNYVLAGNVPGDVSDDFLQAGLIEDPYFYDNYKDSSWITRADWWYEKTFSVQLADLSEHTYIRFDGVDTFSDVYLNGVKIGSTANMHLGYKLCVDGLLKDGENLLAVHLHNVYDAMGEEEQDKYCSIFHANRIFVRKAQCHFSWDWAPKFPGYGIYRDVMLVSEKKAAVDSVAVETELSGDMTFRVAFGDKFCGKVEIKVSLEGQTVASKTLDVSAKKFLTNLHIDDPALWWPRGYGKQPIYEYTICQHYGDEVTVHRGTFGFRKVEIDTSVWDGDGLRFRLCVNGKPIFCRGSNWVPADCMTGRLKDERYYELVKSAADANFNMFRIWGGGIYEKDCFYEYCDRMGILVWQEFMFACSEIPEDNLEFIQGLTKEAEYQVKRLRNHPCLAMWCGMNEIRGAFNADEEERYSVFTLHYLLRGITGQLSPQIPYIRTSPYAFADTENDECEGDSHKNLSEPCLFNQGFSGFDDVVYEEREAWEQLRERIKNYERFLPETKSNFSSECAVLGMCSYESICKFTPKEEMHLESAFFEDRFLGNPYTYVMPTFFERQQKIAEGMYGKPADLQDLVKKINVGQADIMRSEILYCRSNDRSWGLLNWMYNDIWPTGTWSVVDYYMDKKPAYYAMQQIMAKMADFADEPEKARTYRAEAEETKRAIRDRFINGDCVDNNGQGALAEVLYFRIVEGEQAEKIAAKLARTMAEDGYSYKVGILGMKALLNALSEYGYTEEAYKSVDRDDYPSYGYWKKLGATTLWECWENTSFGSQNHHMYADVVNWMFRNIGGVQNAGIAYDKCALKPYFFEENCSASAQTETPRGLLSFAWKKDGDRFTAEIILPENTEASVYLPGRAPILVQSGHMEIQL